MGRIDASSRLGCSLRFDWRQWLPCYFGQPKNQDLCLFRVVESTDLTALAQNFDDIASGKVTVKRRSMQLVIAPARRDAS
jgi:hypothetical protein